MKKKNRNNRTNGKRRRSADELDRGRCMAMIRRAGTRGVAQADLSRRAGRLGCEIARLVGDCHRVTEQYILGRGIVYYWNRPTED